MSRKENKSVVLAIEGNILITQQGKLYRKLGVRIAMHIIEARLQLHNSKFGLKQLSTADKSFILECIAS